MLTNAALIAFLVVLRILSILNPFKIYKSLVKVFFKLPMIRAKIDG